MKGIILAGGKGTRLLPLTKAVNKHLLPVGPEPMIYNPVRNMTACGIKDVLIVTSSSHIGDMVTLLGSGKEFGIRFVYTIQDDARGIADALLLGKSFVGNENVFVLLGDNYFDTPPDYFLSHYRTRQGSVGARVMLVEVAVPSEFGIAALDEKKVIEIQEKPQKPKSNYAVVGAYLYDRKLWDVLDRIRPSKRGEYEITSVNNAYIRRRELEYDFVKGMWMDTGTFESYYFANKYIYERLAGRSKRHA